MSKSIFKSTYGLLGLFMALLIVVVFYANDGAEKKRHKAAQDKLVISGRDIKRVDEVQITRPGQPAFVMEEKENQWMTGETVLDTDEMQIFLDELAMLPSGQRVAKNESSWQKFGVDYEAAVELVLLNDGKPLYQFAVGKAGPTPGSHYLRRKKDDVYLIKSNLPQFLNKDLKAWKDKSVFDLNVEDIRQVTVKIGEDRWQYQLEASQWSEVTEQGTQEVSDQATFTEYLSEMLKIKATGFESDVDSFTDFSSAVALLLKDESEYVVQFGQSGERYGAQASGKAEIFVLSGDLTSRLKPTVFAQVDEEREGSETPSSPEEAEL